MLRSVHWCLHRVCTLGRQEHLASVVAGHRAFGRHPKHDPGPLPTNRDWPRVKDLTNGLIKPIKRKEWLRQPMPYIKDEPKDQRKERRDIYMYQRSLPAPNPYVILHGSHTKLESDSTFRRWWYIDAKDQVMGRLATQITRVIMGKHKPIYDPSFVMGDFVVVVNADKIKLTGKKMDQKLYTYHTGYPGGLVRTPIKEMMKDEPEEILRRAVSGMLPKNLLRRERLKLLRIFVGPNHTHGKEQLEPLPSFLKVASPWVKQAAATEQVVEAVEEGGKLEVLGADNKALPELVDQSGNKYSLEFAEAVLKHGGIMFDDDAEEGGFKHPLAKPAAPAAKPAAGKPAAKKA